MAKTAMKIKQQRKQKFAVREYNRCRICGRPHAYLRKYGICRICFRENTESAESASVSWHTRARFLALRKQAGRHPTLSESAR